MKCDHDMMIVTTLGAPSRPSGMLYRRTIAVNRRRRRDEMPAEIVAASGKLLEVKIRGTLRKADYEGITRAARDLIAREGTIRALIISDGFRGWERGKDWGDVTFSMEEGQRIERMALVGDEQWRDESLAFTGQGFRPTTIEFFPAARLADARRWLAA
jgi:hypothetical protein